MSTIPDVTPPRRHWIRSVGIAIGAAVAVLLIVLAFIWPTVTSSAKDLPIAVAGPSAAVSTVTDALEKQAPGVFDVRKAADRDAAVMLIRNRTVDGAILLGPAPEVLTASAEGAAVTQILAQLAPQLQAQAKVTVTVTDVVPLASTDSRGVGLTAAAFPLVLGGILGGIMISLLVSGVWRRLVSVIVYAAATGFGVAAVLQAWFGVLQRDFLLNGLAIGLATLATAAFIVGMNALIGRAGIAVGSVITMLIGNPLSSAAQPVQFTAAPWGAIGQWFVPGASTTLIRDLSYFPHADTTFPWLVLCGWTLAGLIAMAAGHFRSQVVVRLPDDEPEPAVA